MTLPRVLLGTFVVAVLVPALDGCASAIKMNSDLVKTPPVVDGKANEWEGKLYIFKDQGLLIGAQDDQKNVYLCVEGLDPGTSRRIMRGGVTVWFDPGTGVKNKFGVRYGGGQWGGTREQDDQLFHPMTPSDIEILGPGKEVRMKVPSISSEQEYGISVALRDSGGAAVFELKIPRGVREGMVGIGEIADQSLGVEVETLKGRGSRGSSSSYGGFGAGEGEEGRRGGGVRGGMGRGGRPGGEEGGTGESQDHGGPQRLETTSVSLRVHLAS
jgi:hypothetical protein